MQMQTLINMVEWLPMTYEDQERAVYRAKFLGEEYQISFNAFWELANEAYDREHPEEEPTIEELKEYGRREAALVFIRQYQDLGRRIFQDIDPRKVAEFLCSPSHDEQMQEAKKLVQLLIRPWGLRNEFSIEEAERCIRLFLKNMERFGYREEV